MLAWLFRFHQAPRRMNSQIAASAARWEGSRMVLESEIVAGAIGDLRNMVSDLETTLAWTEYRELHELRRNGQLDSQLLQRRYGYLRERLNTQARIRQGYEPVADERQPGHDYRVRE